MKEWVLSNESIHPTIRQPGNQLILATKTTQQLMRRDRGSAANLGMIPIKGIGESEDIANAVAFIASDAASFTTGQALHVIGGTLLH